MSALLAYENRTKHAGPYSFLRLSDMLENARTPGAAAVKTAANWTPRRLEASKEGAWPRVVSRLTGGSVTMINTSRRVADPLDAALDLRSVAYLLACEPGALNALLMLEDLHTVAEIRLGEVGITADAVREMIKHHLILVEGGKASLTTLGAEVVRRLLKKPRRL